MDIVTPYKIKKECYLLKSYLVGARRMLLLMIKQVFLLMERFGRCVMQIHNAQQTGERRPDSREKVLVLNIPWLALKYEFLYFYLLLDWLYFTVKYLFQQRFMDANFMNYFIFYYFYLLNTWKDSFPLLSDMVTNLATFLKMNSNHYGELKSSMGNCPSHNSK